jgi:hypothetical protein
MATANERTSRQIGSSRPICSDPNAASTRKMTSPMYFSWNIGRYLLASMLWRLRRMLNSQPTKLWSVP